MSLLTQIVAADDDDIVAIGESLNPVDEWSGIEKRDIDTAKLATLHCLLTGESFDEAIARYEPCYVASGEGALVLRLADEACERLMCLDEHAIEDIGIELAGTEDFETTGWDEHDIIDFLTELVDLAQIADAQDQHIFVWMHPLRS